MHTVYSKSNLSVFGFVGAEVDGLPTESVAYHTENTQSNACKDRCECKHTQGVHSLCAHYEICKVHSQLNCSNSQLT